VHVYRLEMDQAGRNGNKRNRNSSDEVLRRKAHKVTAFDKELQKIVDDMVETMRQAPGVGLAAPQIGLPLRLIVVEYDED